MTIHYTCTMSEQAYLEAHAALMKQEEAKPMESFEPAAEVPDMNEAERVWKLLCQAAQGN